MMSKPVIASALTSVKHIAVADLLAAERFGGINLRGILMDLYDTVDERLLDYLAEELDLLGFNGWVLADTEEKKRNLLKAAAQIKRTAGTPASIKTAGAALGISGEIEVREGVNVFYNSEFKYDGAVTYGGNSWATFSVFIFEDQNPDITDQELILFRNMIDNLKPVRSNLIGVFRK